MLHLALVWWLRGWDLSPPQARETGTSIIVDLSDPPPEPEPEPEPLIQPPEEERKLDPITGQVVELPDPEKEEEPEEADYLASKSRRVEEETRAEKFKINPEVLAPEYSEDAPQEDQQDFQEQRDERQEDQAQQDGQPSEAASRDNEPLPEDDFALYPNRFSRWAFVDQGGPMQSASQAQEARSRTGAPQNDYLQEKLGESTLLNSREFLYADYFNKVRRLVNFWWSQNLDNLSPGDVGQPLRRPSYRTMVLPTLDAKGHLISVDLVRGSGVAAFDKAVLDAFKAASPFPEPPDGLVVNGRAELIRFDFILELGRQQSQYTAIDPRANVRFPGIAWPR